MDDQNPLYFKEVHAFQSYGFQIFFSCFKKYFCLCAFYDPLTINIQFLLKWKKISPLADIDECSTGTHNCDANANCFNTRGYFSCTCKTGFQGNGVNCIGMTSMLIKVITSRKQKEKVVIKIQSNHTCNLLFVCRIRTLNYVADDDEKLHEIGLYRYSACMRCNRVNCNLFP